MITLTIKTDQPDAEIGLLMDGQPPIVVTWLAHRQLAETIHLKIAELLASQNITWDSLTGIICFQGPGSFTGLRIGLSVANALAAGLRLPIVGTMGETWVAQGQARLYQSETDTVVLPEYGTPVHITLPRK